MSTSIDKEAQLAMKVAKGILTLAFVGVMLIFIDIATHKQNRSNKSQQTTTLKPCRGEKAEPRRSVEKLAHAIKKFEGFYPGSRSHKNNNPGNLRSSKYQTGIRGGYAYFDDYATGWRALLYQLEIAMDGRSSVYQPGMTLSEFFSAYAPSTDGNHPKSYTNFVADKLGVSASAKISSFCF